MGVTTLFLSLVALVALSLGATILANNHGRKVNQAFLAAAMFMLLWLSSNLFTARAHNAEVARSWLKLAFSLSACIPTTFQLLRLVVGIFTKSSLCSLDYVPEHARETEVKYAMINTHGFDRSNGSIVLKKI